jgi:hypothetical protein
VGAWQELSSVESSGVWDRFYDRFQFRPSVLPEQWPGIAEPEPSVTYRFEYPSDPGEVVDLHESALAAFRACTPPGGRMVVLDWQHACYRFSPHVSFEEWERPDLRNEGFLPVQPIDFADLWLVPVFPNGDYSVFLAPDLSWGLFGHPWEQTICVFGEALLAAFGARPPRLFRDVVRRSSTTRD